MVVVSDATGQHSGMLSRALQVCCASVFIAAAAPAAEVHDVVVYGGTSAGVTAAVQAKRMGASVVIVCPDTHLGGLSSSGLGFTDTGNKAVIGGLAREFYHRIWRHYQEPGAWRQEAREDYGNRGQGTPAIDGEQRTMWIFEPHVAEGVFEDLVREAEIPVHRDRWLDRETGVTMEEHRIESLRTLDGTEYRGRMFIDATYEGDLMAAAGVTYTVGRESRAAFGERWNGVQIDARHHGHHFGVVDDSISAYRVPGDPTSGLLPFISAEPPGEDGAGDCKVQAYCYRMCLTRVPENRIPFPKPANYDPADYELLARIYAAGWRGYGTTLDLIPNLKTDSNNNGPFSTDAIGLNHNYPEASYEERVGILQRHRDYQQGLMYFIANDPRVPEEIRSYMSGWGLAKDEFTDNGGWPHQIYVREARRMIGEFIMTEHEIMNRRPVAQPVGMGSYNMDSHNVQRYVDAGGRVRNEGDLGVRLKEPYAIDYRALLPKRTECGNLLVPACVSSTHIAYGSIRMEPVFMILGQSAATAAVLALENGTTPQSLDYALLAKRLQADGQILEFENSAIGAP